MSTKTAGIEEYQTMIKPYQEAMSSLLVHIDALNEEYRMRYRDYPIHNIQSRIKNSESIQAKLKRKGHPPALESAKDYLTDIAGIRIICYFEQDIVPIAAHLKKYSDTVIVKECDYVTQPKPNGYRSYHLVLGTPVYRTDCKQYYPVEIQIRSLAMDLWASMEHRMLYKAKEANQERIRERFKGFASELKEMENQLYELEF
ncbi:(p)ppGpp synthetase [Ruminococcus sp. OA3]|uniref:GTP pyrophosphokinase n=1 Tax=Ruminococcus sp. OA3 TaxID=2914164 RepID=UPI001F06C730|nr:(p)ppGpp synthetase [Ruminococcus sp. OA3]MCH1983732.1 (p)ppGpp synthetase [Ruminococcus sp. OA3]